METLSLHTQQVLEFLMYTTIILMVIIAGFIIKLLADLSNLVKSIQNIAIVVKHELEPTLKELKNTIVSLNSLASMTDAQLRGINKTLTDSVNKISDTTKNVSTKLKSTFTNLKKNIIAGIKVFTNK